MGKSERRKGADGEREIVRLAEAAGLSAELTWSTAFSFDPRERACDVLIGGKVCQVKRRKRAWGDLYCALADVQMVAVRSDEKPWLVVMRFEDWIRTATNGENAAPPAHDREVD